MSIELVMPSNHLLLCCPLLFLFSTFPSLGVFSNESALHIMWQVRGWQVVKTSLSSFKTLELYDNVGKVL